MQQRQFYIIVAVLVTLVFAVIIFFGVRSSSIQSQPPAVSRAVAGIEPTVSEQIPTPSIEEVSGRPQVGEKKARRSLLRQLFLKYIRNIPRRIPVIIW